MPYGTAQDVLDRWVGENPPSVEVASVWVADAEVLIRAEYGGLIDEKLLEGSISAGQVAMVVARMVIRALRNPDNVRMQQTGPFATTYAGDNPGGLYLTDDDRALLGGVAAGAGQKAFTVNTTPEVSRDGYWSAPDVWTPLT